MNKNFKLLAAATLLIVLVTSLTWWALDCISCRSNSANLQSITYGNWAKELNLTKEQQEKLSKLDENVQPKLEKLTLQLSQVRLLLCDLLRKSEIHKDDLDKYTSEIGRLQAEEEKSTVLHLLDIKNILTPDQSQIFFTTIMRDICTECSHATGICECLCGFCDTK